MNAERRKRIEALGDQIEDMKTEIESIKGEEQDYLDDMPESFAEKRERAEAVVEQLEEAYNAADEALASLMNARE